MIDKLKQLILNRLKKPEAETIHLKNAQSWNPETNAKYRNGHPGNSALVESINYDGNKLQVKYRDGFTAEYNGLTAKQVWDFCKSDSKGRWALKHLWDKDYKKV